jgi:hypothetical protein
LPAYFLNVDKYSLSLTVWIYALPVALFGKSILVVRGTAVCFGLFGVASMMLVLKWFFSSRLWWAGGLVMASLPAWLIHSRTGFETPFMVSFFATFLLTCLLYRVHSPRWLPAAVVAGAATFYSYTNGQGVMFVSCLLLLIVDWPYHRRVIKENRRAFSSGVLAIVLVSAPYLHFRFVRQPEIMVEHLKILRSYWVTDQPLTDKLATFGSTYLRGLSPGNTVCRSRARDTPVWHSALGSHGGIRRGGWRRPGGGGHHHDNPSRARRPDVVPGLRAVRDAVGREAGLRTDP